MMKYSILVLLAASTAAAFFPSWFASAQTTPTMGIPDGYFSHRGTVYARSGGTICGFSRPGHLQIYRTAFPAPTVTVPGISSYRSAGICSVPASFFPYQGTVFYSFGNRRYCGFSDPDSLREYRQYYNSPNVSELSSPPQEFMTYDGTCPPPR